MKNNRKVLLLVLVVVLVLLCSITLFACNKKGNGAGGGATSVLDKVFLDADTVNIGATKSDVEAILGKPHDSNAGLYTYYDPKVIKKVNEQEKLFEQMFDENITEEQANKLLEKIEKLEKEINSMNCPILYIFFEEGIVDSVMVNGDKTIKDKEIKKQSINKSSIPIFANRDDWGLSYEVLCKDGSYKRAKLSPNIDVYSLGVKNFKWSDEFGTYEGKVNIKDEILSNYTYKCYVNSSLTIDFKTKSTGSLENIPNADIVISGSAQNTDFGYDSYYQDCKLMFNKFKDKVNEVFLDKSVGNIDGNLLSQFKNKTFIKVDNKNTSLKNVNGNILNAAQDTLLYSDNASTNLPASVTKIGSYAFACNYNLTQVHINSNIQEIGEGAFAGCKNVGSVTSSNSIYTVDKNCIIQGDTLIASFDKTELPETVTKFGPGSYAYTSLQTVTVPINITTISDNAFFSSKNLRFVKLQDGSLITSIGNYAFNGCENEVFFEMPTTLYKSLTDTTFLNVKFTDENITEYVYDNDVYKLWISKDNKDISGLKNFISNSSAIIYFEDDKETISEKYNIQPFDEGMVFDCLNNLKTPTGKEYVELNQCLYKLQDGEATLSRIPQYFTSMNYLSQIRYKDDLYKIEEVYNVTGIENLQNITISEGIKQINENAFWNCGQIVSIRLPNSIETIKNSFSHCENLKSVYHPSLDNWLKINFNGYHSNPLENGANLYFNNYLFENLYIYDNVTEIKTKAFNGCLSLKSVKLHGDLTVESCAFEGCKNIKTLKFDSLDDLLSVEYRDSTSNPLNASGGDIIVGEEVLKNVNLKNIEIINNYTFYKSSIETVEMDDSIQSFNHCTFSNCNELTSIRLSNNITEIPSSAFRYCRKLKDVNFPENLTLIEDYAFDYTAVEQLNFPNKLEEIGMCAFDHCLNIKNVTIPASLKKVGQDVFQAIKSFDNLYISDLNAWMNMDSLSTIGSKAQNIWLNNEKITSIKIPDNITKIKDVTFCGFKDLIEIDLNNVTEIGSLAFYNCTSIESIDLSKVTLIDSEAFLGCTNLKNIVFSKNLDTISYGAFSNCVNLPSLTFEDTKLKEIGDYAFTGCKNIEYIQIPNTIEKLGYHLFDYAHPKFIAIDVPSKLPGFDNAFATTDRYYLKVLYNNKAIINIDNAYYGITDGHAKIISSNTTNKDLIIPDSISHKGVNYPVEEILPYAFKNNDKLVNVTLPKNIKIIDGNSFYGCPYLNNLIVDSLDTWLGIKFERTYYYSNGYQLMEDFKALVIGDEILTNLVIPDNVTEIGIQQFASIQSLQSVTIPSSVKKIDEAAFYDCNNLTSVNFSDGLESIGAKAFANTNITEAVLPNTVLTIGDGVFSECEELTNVSVGNQLKVIPYRAFYFCANLKNITLNDCITTIKDEAFERCQYLIEITLPNSCTTIEGEPFSYCSGLLIKCEAATKPSGWNRGWNYCYGIGSWSSTPECAVIWDYLNCEPTYYTDLNGIVYRLYDTRASIYVQNNNITKIHIPEYIEVNGKSYIVDYILEHAFGTCKDVTEITVDPNNKKYWSEGNCLIDENNQLIKGCKNSIIPNTVDIIGSYSFRFVDMLELDIPEGVVEIKIGAFDNCKIKRIIIPSSVTTISDSICKECFDTIFVLKNKNNSYASDWNMVDRNQDFHCYYVWYEGETDILYEDDCALYIISNNSARVHRFKDVEEIVIPDTITVDNVSYNVEGVDIYAASRTKVKSLTLPSTIKSINDRSIVWEIDKLYLTKVMDYDLDFGITNIRFIFCKGTEEEWKNARLGEFDYSDVEHVFYYN